MAVVTIHLLLLDFPHSLPSEIQSFDKQTFTLLLLSVFLYSGSLLRVGFIQCFLYSLPSLVLSLREFPDVQEGLNYR